MCRKEIADTCKFKEVRHHHRRRVPLDTKGCVRRWASCKIRTRIRVCHGQPYQELTDTRLPCVACLHEPKERHEKLAQRSGGHNGHPLSSRGATSLVASEAGESYAGWPSPSSHPAVLQHREAELGSSTRKLPLRSGTRVLGTHRQFE